VQRANRKLGDALVRRRDEELLVLYAAGALSGRERRRAALIAGTAAGERFLLELRTSGHAQLGGWAGRRRMIPGVADSAD
jgi:hypothetical protein